MREPDDDRDQTRDEDLMARVAQGNEAAFRTLCDRHLVRAVALARRTLGNDADAEEVVQEAFLRVWRAAPRWEPTAAFSTWLHRIVVNLCLNHKRRVPHAPLDAAGDPADPAPDAEAQLESRAERARLAGAIGTLPARQRAAVLLTYWEGLSNNRTAQIMGTTVGGVETLLVRARKALRARLIPSSDEG
ncbi:sigma-70 family RNA polymerase sigma factor [Azorhizobium oxalatiphilum]|nr:sigma-70 family RNA polymerase sigma factor [Azorhizobium oxalatiphilum]